jgi:hypothetical protein
LRKVDASVINFVDSFRFALISGFPSQQKPGSIGTLTQFVRTSRITGNRGGTSAGGGGVGKEERVRRSCGLTRQQRLVARKKITLFRRRHLCRAVFQDTLEDGIFSG